MGACARNMYSDPAEIKPAQFCIKALIRRCDDLPATITHVPVAAVLVLNTPDDGRLRPKHVEWLCRNKTCTILHQVGVSFELLWYPWFSAASAAKFSLPVQTFPDAYPTSCAMGTGSISLG